MSTDEKYCGVILAGGTGSRLFPATNTINKHLLHVYDKPAIYYSISMMLHSGITDIALICRPEDLQLFKRLLGDGSQFGLKLTYLIQQKPNGIAEAYLIAERFIRGRRSMLILGDNLLHGEKIGEKLRLALENESSNFIITYKVNNPRQFGVAELDQDGIVLSIEEKPSNPKSDNAVIGIYIFNESTSIVKNQKASQRGELEITDLCDVYRKNGSLRAVQLGRGYTWLDTGTPDDLLAASNYIHTIQTRQGFYIACLEEIAFRKGLLSQAKIKEIKRRNPKSAYDKYVQVILSQ